MLNNSKEITIDASLIIPLGELAIYVLKRREKNSCILDLLYNKPEIVNKKVKKIINEIIFKKKADIKLKELKFDYNDSDKFSIGASYFYVKLKGIENELKKIAEEDKALFFDWEKN